MHYILAIFLLTASLYAKQANFSIIINEPFNDSLLDVTQDFDRSITAVGFVTTKMEKSTKTGSAYTNAFDYLSSISANHGSKIHLLKVDEYANVTLRNSTSLNSFNKAVSVLKTPNNGYYIGGYTLDGSLLIIKLDTNGNIIFSKSFGTNNFDKMSSLVLLGDGGVLAIGASTTTRSTSDNLFERGLGLSDMYISRFSKSGQRLWSKKYGTEYDDKAIDAVEANDGSIIIIGQTNHDKFKNMTIMRMTENGDKIWLNHYKNDKITTPHKVIKLRDGNFLTSVSEQDEIFKEQIKLIKFDLQMNIISDKEIHTTYSSVLKDIKEYTNSNIIGVGYVKDAYNTDGLAMLFNSDLRMLSQEHYGDENSDTFNAVTILHNSQAAAVGIHTNPSSQESNMWLAKLNKDLTMAQVTAKSVDIYATLSNIFKHEIGTHKISIKEDLSIEFLDNELNFKTAQYELNEMQKTFLEKFSTKLLPFLHVNKNLIDSFEINGHTSSEWAGVDFADGYLNNEKLSMNRSFATISHMFKNQDKPTKKWLTGVIKGSGLSYSKVISFNEIENKEKSRRVSFKIILK